MVELSIFNVSIDDQVLLGLFVFLLPAIFISTFFYLGNKENEETKVAVREQFLKMYREGEQRRERERLKKRD